MNFHAKSGVCSSQNEWVMLNLVFGPLPFCSKLSRPLPVTNLCIELRTSRQLKISNLSEIVKIAKNPHYLNKKLKICKKISCLGRSTHSILDEKIVNILYLVKFHHSTWRWNREALMLQRTSYQMFNLFCLLTPSASLTHLSVKTGMLRSRQWRFRESLESELEKRRVKTNIFPFHPKQKVNSLSWLASKNVNFGHGKKLNKTFFVVNLIKQSLRTYPRWRDGAHN